MPALVQLLQRAPEEAGDLFGEIVQAFVRLPADPAADLAIGDLALPDECAI